MSLPKYVQDAADAVKRNGVDPANVQEATNEMVRLGLGKASAWVYENKDEYLSSLAGKSLPQPNGVVSNPQLPAQEEPEKKKPRSRGK